MANGVDLYTKYQTVTDWAAVRASGIEFAYVKAADGLDPKNTGGWGPAGRRAGVKMGAYLYAQPGTPVSQANLLCDQAFLQGLSDLAPALDIESNAAIYTWGTQEAITFSIAFLNQVKARGYRPCLYGNNSMLTGIRAAVLKAVPETIIWAARYGAQPTVAYDVWQHDDRGVVPGIGGAVDLNVGPIPLNTTGGTAPAVDQEETENMSSDRGEATPPNEWGVLHIPINGHRYLRIATSYAHTMTIDGITMVDDTPGSTGSNGRTVQAGGIVAADRPGPWDLAGADAAYANFSHVTVRYQCAAAVKGWTNDRA